MNTTVRKHYSLRIILVLFTVAILSTGTHASTGCPLQVPAITGDTLLVQKQFTSKKHRVRLYQDAEQQVLFFGVKGSDEKVYQLFMFDTAGKLIQQANIKGKQTTVIDNIEKGTYLFEVFSDDERIENGQVILR